MKSMKLILLGLCSLAFFLIPIDAHAGRVVVRVAVKKPVRQVRVVKTVRQVQVVKHSPQMKVKPHGWCGTGSSSHRISRERPYVLTRLDKWMATRLSRESGVSRRFLLKDRSRKYSWNEIGRMWSMPKRMVRRALADGRRAVNSGHVLTCGSIGR